MYRKIIKKIKAFTFLELLLAFSILAVVGSIIILILNPARRLNDLNNAQYASRSIDIENAIKAYTLDNSTFPPNIVALPSAGFYDICKHGLSGDCVNLDILVTNQYLQIIPVDSRYSTATNSGYKFKYNNITASIYTYSYEEYLDEINTGNTLFEGLIGYWKLDEGSANTCSGPSNDACDSTDNGNDGAWNGSIDDTAGRYGNGVDLDGSGDYITIGTVPLFNISAANFTLCSWFKTSGMEEDILSNGSANNGNWLLMSYNSKLRGHAWYAGNSNTIDSNALVNDNLWHHGCQVVDSTKIYLYVDGNIDNSQNLVGTKLGIAGNTVIGARQASTASSNFIGTLDEVRIYDRALTAEEINALYNWGAAYVAYWKFDENTGTTANDSSGNGNTGTLINGATWTTGKFGTALNFDGINDHVSISNSSNIPISNQNYTLTAWVKPNSSGDKGIVGWGNYGSGNQVNAFSLTSCTGSNLGFIHYWWGNDLIGCSSNLINGNNWYYATVTFDGTTRKIYLDGMQIATDSPTGHNVPNTNNFRLGSTNNSDYFDGTIDEIKIYNYARTQSQIIKDMNNE